MRKILLSLGAVLALCAPLMAADTGRDLKTIHKVFTGAVALDASADPAMHVTFRHDQHKTLRCEVCHHTIAEGENYKSCSGEEGCHTITGVSTEQQSRFQAFHSPGNERSCYACHLQERARFDGVKGCTTCHAQLKADAPLMPASEKK